MMTSLFRSRRSWLVLAGAALPFALLGMSNAWAEGAPGPGFASNPQQRIHELEERVRILELTQETLERRLHLDVERNGRAFEEIDRRLRALEDRPATPAAPAAPASSPDKNAALEAMCKDPYFLVAPGIRRVKPGCESTGTQCDAPEAVDAHGVRHVLPGCLQTIDKNRNACDPPYYFDDKGMKHVKDECM
jgi:hypothetical protein